MPSHPNLPFSLPRWIIELFRSKKVDGDQNGENNNDGNSDDNNPISNHNFECYACTQVGVPVFHSTSCDQAHQPEWEASAGSSLVPIQARSKILGPKDGRPASATFAHVFDPRSKRVQRLNRAFLLARGMSLAVDPLFFYALSIGRGGAPCLYMDGALAAIVTVLRTCVDAVHLFHLWLQFRLAYVSRESLVVGCGKLVWDPRAIASHYVRSLKGFWFDVFVILPVPQAVFWLVVPKLIREEKIKMIMTILLIIFLFQFLPKVYHSIYLMRRMQKVTGYIFGTIWWGFGLNLIAYFIASHVAGGCWYVLAIQRVASCLRQQCHRQANCNLYLSCSEEVCYQFLVPSGAIGNTCGGNSTTTVRKSLCLDVNGPFHYGIYQWALPVISSNSVAVKILYPIFWGLMTLSTFGNDLEPTSHWLEVMFSICIVLSGLMLFTLLIGNIQVFLHAVMAKKRKMQLRCRQLQGLQQYHYPSPYYQLDQGSAPQGGGSTSVIADKVSLSVESNKDNPMANGPGVSGNGRSKLQRPNYQYPYLDPNSSHGRGGLSTVVPSPSYQDPGYSFDGIHSPITWLDTSIFGGGQSKHNVNAGYTSPISHSNNFPSGRNQNHRPHLANFHHTRPTSDAFGYMSQMYANNPMYGHYGNTFRAGPGYGSFGYDSWISGRGWYPVDSKYKPRGRGYGASGSGKENVDGLNELNKGPRAKGFKNQEGFDPVTVAAKGQNLKSSESTPEDNLPLIPDKEKYGGEDFPESYSDAKFFIIKSYSEDDVHKSVKYNMWTSTPNGNKKLDAAYREAKEKSSDCPVFLLFSVNASGQFVGVAEMVGPVDFDKTVEYWQQDKWVGCFPLKWHIIKDVPNSSLRHITLENNENKPVTNSRDTQEVNFEIGIQILKIFKSHSSKRCILDDFGFYEARERIMQQKKAKQHQLQRQVSDGKPSDVIIDDKDKDVALAKDRVQKSQEETLVKELALTETIGDVKLEENGSAATVEDAVKGAKSAVSSGKKGTSNGVASAC